MWQEIITTLGGSAILVAAVAWLTRSVVLHVLNKDIETYKARLRREMLEHEVRFRRVDEKVADHLSELYERLFKLYRAVNSYVQIIEWSHEPTKEEKRKLASEANRDFNEFLFPKRLYIPQPLFERTKDIGGRLASIANDFTMGLEREEKGIVTEQEDHWIRAMDAIKNDIDPLFEEIVMVFQRRLGLGDEEEEGTRSGDGSIGVGDGDAEEESDQE